MKKHMNKTKIPGMSADASDAKPNNEVDELVHIMSQEMASYSILWAHQSEPKPFIIHKLHPIIKSVDPESYDPTVVSIGPYHHGTEMLSRTESEKFKCLKSILDSSGEINMDKLFSTLEKEEKMTRNVYSKRITMGRNTFLKMMALDSCYILGQVLASDRAQLNHAMSDLKPGIKKSDDKETDLFTPLLGKERKEGDMAGTGKKNADSTLFYRPWCSPYVVRDLLLLENQIPFFIVEKIYENIAGEFSASALREKTTLFVRKLIQPYLNNCMQEDICDMKQNKFHHLLHLCHMHFKPVQNHKEFEYEKFEGSQEFIRHVKRWHGATQYEEAGISLKSKKYDENVPHSLLDITFENDVIEIPFLAIDENTISLFRNLVALEQMCSKYGDNFTAYVIFLSQIMCMPSDVALLVRKGIIAHNLISDENVSNQLASLTKSVVFDFRGKYYLKSMSWEVEERYQACQEECDGNWFTNSWWMY